MESDLIVTCPYNPAHRIRKWKLMSHISKCKKSSDTKNKIECPLDSSHIVDRNSIKEHIASCSALGKIVKVINDVDDEKQKTDTEFSVDAVPPEFSTENWSEEPEYPTYNPMESTKDRKVFRCMPGLSKAEKKRFRKNERNRIANLECDTAKQDLFSKKDMMSEIPLRPPRGNAEVLSFSETIESNSDTDDTAKANRFLKKETIYEESTRAPRSIAEVLSFSSTQNDSNDNAEIYKHTSIQCEEIKQDIECERSELPDYFYINKQKGNLSLSDWEQKTEAKQIDINAYCEIFDVDNLKKEKSKCIGSTSSAPVSNEQVADTLQTLLNNQFSDKNAESMKLMQNFNQSDEKLDQEKSRLDELFNKFSNRLTYLTEIQNLAAQESVQLLKQLHELKLQQEIVFKK